MAQQIHHRQSFVRHLVPDTGRCEILGRVPWKERIAHVAQIGVVFGQRTQLWWDLPVIESFDLLRDIYRVDHHQYAQTRDEMIAILDLESLLDIPVRQLSLGQRMRCDLAAALLHRPSILFLDEPTIGLDVVSKLAVRDFIKRLNQERDVTVILTTHDMDDIEALCTRVMVIGQGQILSDGPLENLRARVTTERRLIVDLEEIEDITDPDASAYCATATEYISHLTPTALHGRPDRPHHSTEPRARPFCRKHAHRRNHLTPLCRKSLIAHHHLPSDRT